MPILDVEIVLAPEASLPDGLARTLADRAAEVFGSARGHCWVRLHPLPATAYAENGETDPPTPAFVRVLLASLPPEPELDAIASALADAVAIACARTPDAVHVLFEPPAAGRIAFGGELVRRLP